MRQSGLFYYEMEGKRDVKDKMNRAKGLTIVELVVVMCILAVMVLIAIPNIGRWLPRYRLRSAVRDVASAMQLARLGAIKDNKQWGIGFDIGAETYTVWSSGDDGRWFTGDDVAISTTSLADYRNVSFGDNGYGSWLGGPLAGPFSDGVTFQNNRVIFMPDGTAGVAWPTGIVGSAYLENNRGDAACARIRFSGTGVEVVHWDGDSWEP
jgi:type II secretory pathway pseudopilin PulG